MVTLSVQLRMVHLQMSKFWTAASKWRRPLASSRAKFVNKPVGFESDTRLLVMSLGHWMHHRIGLQLGWLSVGTDGMGNHTPQCWHQKRLGPQVDLDAVVRIL